MRYNGPTAVSAMGYQLGGGQGMSWWEWFNVFVGCDLETGGVGGVADRWELSHDGGKRTCYLRPTQGSGGVTRPSVTCQTCSICARVAASSITVFPATTGIAGMPLLPRSAARLAARSTS